MKIKLTLTVEKEVIEKAKIYAKKTDRSLSEIIENYLNEITDESLSTTTVSPQLKKLVGSVKLPKNFNEDKVIREFLEKKHL
jgi:predicted DNA-binding protein